MLRWPRTTSATMSTKIRTTPTTKTTGRTSSRSIRTDGDHRRGEVNRFYGTIIAVYRDDTFICRPSTLSGSGSAVRIRAPAISLGQGPEPAAPRLELVGREPFPVLALREAAPVLSLGPVPSAVPASAAGAAPDGREHDHLLRSVVAVSADILRAHGAESWRVLISVPVCQLVIYSPRSFRQA